MVYITQPCVKETQDGKHKVVVMYQAVLQTNAFQGMDTYKVVTMATGKLNL